MANHVKRLTVLVGSLLASSAGYAAPKPFDLDMVDALANGDPIPSDEEVVLHSIESCSPFTTPTLRVCVEKPLDLDGQPGVDMIVGVNQPVFKRFYSGRNNGLFGNAQYFGLQIASTSGLKVADLDGDGDLDMVETMRGNGSQGNNTVYVNHDGSLASLFNDEQALDSLKHDRSSSVAIGDVNNDGKLDVIVTNETPGGQDNPGGATLPYGQTNYLYLNQTTAANNIVFGPALALDAEADESYTRRGILVDVEGDGDLDLVVTSASNHLDGSGKGNWLYVNGTVGGSPAPAAGANPFAAAIPLNADTADNTDVANAIAAGDIDGDGDPDLVFSTWSRGGASAVTATNRYYINNSTPGSINFETTATFGTPGHHTNVRLADFNGDGRLDALFAVLDGGPNRLYLNTGAQPYFDAGLNLLEPTEFNVDNARGIDAADLNNDGATDFVVVNRNQLGLRFLNNDQCNAGNCGSYNGPFDNYTPVITSQTTALIPPGNAPIDVNQLLSAFAVTDTDNLYPGDHTAVVAQPVGGSNYTCTDGVVPSGPTSGTCANGRITPNSALNTGDVILLDLKVRDGQHSSGSFAATLTVGTGSVPTFITTTLPDALEDQTAPLYSATVEATDLDGNYPLVFEAVGALPSWLSLAAGDTPSTAKLVATAAPQQGDVGEHTITLVARDSTGLQSVPVALTLTVDNVNDKPSVITNALPDGTQGQPYNATVTGADEDGTTPTFTPTTGLPAGLTISPAGVISGTPTVAGTFAVDLIATDGLASSDPVRVDLLIQAAAGTNASPVLTAPGPQTAAVGTAFNLTVTATDADNDPLTFTATGLPAGLTMSAAGVISGTATDAAGSPFTVTVNVSDGKGGTDSETFQLTVGPAGNRPPTFTAPGPQSGTVGVAYTLSLVGLADDPDGDPRTFAATGLPPGVALSPAGLLSGTPTTATGSPFTVNVTVTDGKGGEVTGSFQFTVTNPTSGGGGNSGGSSGGGGSLGFLEVLSLLGLGALAHRPRRVMGRGLPRRGA